MSAYFTAAQAETRYAMDYDTARTAAEEAIEEWSNEEDPHGYCHQRPVLVALLARINELTAPLYSGTTGYDKRTDEWTAECSRHGEIYRSADADNIGSSRAWQTHCITVHGKNDDLIAENRELKARVLAARTMFDALDELRDNPEVIVIRRQPTSGSDVRGHWVISTAGHDTHHSHIDLDAEIMLKILMQKQERDLP